LTSRLISGTSIARLPADQRQRHGFDRQLADLPNAAPDAT